MELDYIRVWPDGAWQHGDEELAHWRSDDYCTRYIRKDFVSFEDLDRIANMVAESGLDQDGVDSWVFWNLVP